MPSTESERRSMPTPTLPQVWILGLGQKMLDSATFRTQEAEDKMGLERHLGERARKMVKATCLGECF